MLKVKDTGGKRLHQRFPEQQENIITELKQFQVVRNNNSNNDGLVEVDIETTGFVVKTARNCRG